MDMGLIKEDAEAPEATRLDYPMLVALLGLNGGGRVPQPSPRKSDARTTYPSAHLRLAAVMLARDGWRDAARALGGRFTAPSDARLGPSTKMTAAFTTAFQQSFNGPGVGRTQRDKRPAAASGGRAGCKQG